MSFPASLQGSFGRCFWESACDSATREDFRSVVRRELLEKVASLRVHVLTGRVVRMAMRVKCKAGRVPHRPERVGRPWPRAGPGRLFLPFPGRRLSPDREACSATAGSRGESNELEGQRASRSVGPPVQRGKMLSGRVSCPSGVVVSGSPREVTNGR